MHHLTRVLLAGTAALAFLAPSAQAETCSLRGCIATVGELACGEDGGKCGIQRCYYWTDYPTCIY